MADTERPPLPRAPATPELAKATWARQWRPSSRSVARALRQAGFSASFPTVARWKRQGWRRAGQVEQPLDVARHALDSAVPVLTGEPTTTSEDVVNGSEDKVQIKELTDEELLRTTAREALRTLILIEREFHTQLPELVKAKPMETG